MIYFNIAYYWKRCNKIIFKCVNSVMGSSFNENFAKLDNLWIL